MALLELVESEALQAQAEWLVGGAMSAANSTPASQTGNSITQPDLGNHERCIRTIFAGTVFVGTIFVGTV